MNRETNLYGNIFEQLGGKTDSKDKTTISQKKSGPKDMSEGDQTSLSKLFEVNRLLQKELDETKRELEKTKAQLEKHKKMNTLL